jgi:aflatoxin B1 aldehyde reductase
MSSVEYIFGGGGLTEAWREDDMPNLQKALQQAKINRIDSAAVYPYTAPGGADALLGDSKFTESFEVDTKALYFGDGSGTLTAEAIQKSLSGSLERLRVAKVSSLVVRPDPLYLHES